MQIQHVRLASVLVLLACGFSTAATSFVDDNAAACGDGQSWPTAYRYLQDALTAARNSGGAITEIWVAAGTYRPDRNCANPTGTGDRTATFQLVNGIALRGGFAGNEDPATFDLSTRDFDANKTTLSGDLAGDDALNWANYGENSYHVATATGVGSTAALDGVVLSGGNANGSAPHGYGGAILISNSSLAIIRCTFWENAGSYGSAIYNTGSSPVLTACSFLRNSGQACANSASNPILTNCSFVQNAETGLHNINNSSPQLVDCTFDGNQGTGVSVSEGCGATIIKCSFLGNKYSGLQVYRSKPMSLSECRFERNGATQGGAIYNDASKLTITSCTFTMNSAFYDGGAICNRGTASLSLEGCIFENNEGWLGSGGAIARTSGTSPCELNVSNCTFVANAAYLGGGAIHETTGYDLIVTGSTFIGNQAWYGNGGAVHAAVGLKADNCQFMLNHAWYASGGGLYTYSSSAPKVAHCSFEQNTCNDKGGGLFASKNGGQIEHTKFLGNEAGTGGGLYMENWGSTTSCLFIGNSAGSGGGVYVAGSDGTASFTNCQLSGNIVTSKGGAMHAARATVLTNCTLMSNAAVNPGNGGGIVATTSLRLVNSILWGSGISPVAGGQPAVSYSCVEGGFSGPTNIAANPLFVDPDGPDDIPGNEDDDLRLRPGSPCIDAGNNGAPWLNQSPTDLAGVLRFLDDPSTLDSGLGLAPIIDMGAYEFNSPPLPDADEDGVPDDQDQCTHTVHGAIVNSVGCPLPIPGDLDVDGDVDGADLAEFMTCALGPAIEQTDERCEQARMDQDDDIDSTDFAIFQRCFSGEDTSADPSCASSGELLQTSGAKL